MTSPGFAQHPAQRPRLTPAVADARRAVRVTVGSAGLNDDALVMLGLSGGPDSVALALACAFELPRMGLRAGAVIVDHGLQDDSQRVAQNAAALARELGLDPVIVETVVVGEEGGPEFAARTARYAAFERVRDATGAARILLAHTRDDQAETVLLGLTRGSGPASLRGMAVDTGEFLRPFLALPRETTVAVCADSGVPVWNDPHNQDPAYTRVRIRHSVLPLLEAELGPGIAQALVRTAESLREDDDALNQFAREWAEELVSQDESGAVCVDIRSLASDPAALRHRIIRMVAHAEFGVSLTRAHTLAVAELMTSWHGQGPLDLPGIRVVRQNGRLLFHPTTSTT